MTPHFRDPGRSFEKMSKVPDQQSDTANMLTGRGLAGPAVHDEIVGALGVFRVQIVHQHSQWRLGHPTASGASRAMWSNDRTGSEGDVNTIEPPVNEEEGQ